MPGLKRLGKYLALASGALTLVVWHAFMTREQFFPAMQYLSSSKVAIATAGNFSFAMGLCLYKLFVKVFLGELREAEIERINERISQAIMETCLALTIFREEFNVEFCAMFTILTFIKVFHWLVSDRVEYMETTPAESRLQHVRIIVFMMILLAVDAAFLQFTVGKVLQRSASVHLLFAFEYVIQASSILSTAAKYVLTTIDAAMDGQWEGKGTYVFYLELTTDLLHLFVYLVFFVIVFANYGLPLHLVRDLYWTFRTFRNRVTDFLRYRRVTANMDQWFPDASEEQLSRADHTCIVCREDMTAGSRNKVLRCGHVFHMHCLRSWLERQQNCPTCRASVMPENTGLPNNAHIAGLAAGLQRELQARRQQLEALRNNIQAGDQQQQQQLGQQWFQRQRDGQPVRADGPRQPEEAAPVRGSAARRASRRRPRPSANSGAEELQQMQWNAWQAYHQQLAAHQAAVAGVQQSQVQAHHAAQMYQYQAATAAAVLQQSHIAQQRHQQLQQPQAQQQQQQQQASSSEAVSASAVSGPLPEAQEPPVADANSSVAVPPIQAPGSSPRALEAPAASPALSVPQASSIRGSSTHQHAPALPQSNPSRAQIESTVAAALQDPQAQGLKARQDLQPPVAVGPVDGTVHGSWPGFSTAAYGYSGFAWNVPQWCPQASMAMFTPAGYAPFPYAGQQNARDLVPQLPADYNQMAPIQPMVLPPALQAMIPLPPPGASPQQIHNHHAAAAAAAAAAASVMSPYSHHLMAPPSLVPMRGGSQAQGASRGPSTVEAHGEVAAVGVSPAAAAAAANAAAAAAAAAVMSAPNSGGLSIEQLRRRQVGILQTQLEGLGLLHDHPGSPRPLCSGRNNGDGGGSLASPSFPPSIASSRGPSLNLDAASAQTLSSPFHATDAAGCGSDSGHGGGDHRSPVSLSTVLSTLARASSQRVPPSSTPDAAVPATNLGTPSVAPVRETVGPDSMKSLTKQDKEQLRTDEMEEQVELRRLRLQRFGS